MKLLPPCWWSINHCESDLSNFKHLESPEKESEQVQSARVHSELFEEFFEELTTYQTTCLMLKEPMNFLPPG